jgi:hypothetical protein
MEDEDWLAPELRPILELQGSSKVQEFFRRVQALAGFQHRRLGSAGWRGAGGDGGEAGFWSSAMANDNVDAAGR